MDFLRDMQLATRRIDYPYFNCARVKRSNS